MKFLRRIYRGLRKNLKFSISNPESFEEVWSFNSNGIRVISLSLILILILSIPISLLFSSNSSYFSSGDVSIEREELEDQNKEIMALSEKIQAQENYILNIQRILNGEVPIDTPLDSVPPSNAGINIDSLNSNETEAERELSEKIKHDMSTTIDKKSAITLFGSPVVGVVSQEFDKKTHPGIDVVTEKDRAVKACFSGTVVYSGYTRKDGYILIVDHGNKYISVYKHNKRVLKKAGAKVQLGDPISIVGSTGENSNGPHLHFELWYDQSPVNPADYINFKR